MKTTYFYILLLISLLSFQSCESYLDIKPKGYVIPQTVEDFERILNDVSLTKFLSDGIEILSDDFYNPSLERDKNVDQVDYRLYAWLKDPYTTPTDYSYYSYWNMIYARIYQYNAIINGIDEAVGGSESRKKVAKARARLGRAMGYYYLVNIYSQPYNKESAKTDLGVPLIQTNSINDPIPSRGTVQETFDFIINDLNEAIVDLPSSSQSVFELNKASGYGWLARTLLIIGDFQGALNAAEEVLALNNTLVDYNTEYDIAVPSVGDPYYIPKAGHQFATIRSQPENIHAITFDYTRGMAFQYVAKETESLFSENDLRRINITPNYANLEDINDWDGTYTYMGSTSYEYNVGIATPEMYLIKAESLARLNQTSDALTTLNKLRKHRILADAYEDFQTNNSIQAIKWTLEERRRELLFKGSRWFDMRRLNQDPDFGFTAKHYLKDGSFFELEPGNPRYVLTIPETALTDGITQNP
ncbi:MAG TPA: RagB/SusD family nutrient uptake outer membrane protein [Candidatus Sphingobacterium stercoripullorum]|nr:RagB/SusD family nutrient uptake outer membrane protein [Candidatus Sphingobacterium stercoripullorum]